MTQAEDGKRLLRVCAALLHRTPAPDPRTRARAIAALCRVAGTDQEFSDHELKWLLSPEEGGPWLVDNTRVIAEHVKSLVHSTEVVAALYARVFGETSAREPQAEYVGGDALFGVRFPGMRVNDLARAALTSQFGDVVLGTPVLATQIMIRAAEADVRDMVGAQWPTGWTSAQTVTPYGMATIVADRSHVWSREERARLFGGRDLVAAWMKAVSEPTCETVVFGALLGEFVKTARGAWLWRECVAMTSRLSADRGASLQWLLAWPELLGFPETRSQVLAALNAQYAYLDSEGQHRALEALDLVVKSLVATGRDAEAAPLRKCRQVLSQESVADETKWAVLLPTPRVEPMVASIEKLPAAPTNDREAQVLVKWLADNGERAATWPPNSECETAFVMLAVALARERGRQSSVGLRSEWVRLLRAFRIYVKRVGNAGGQEAMQEMETYLAGLIEEAGDGDVTELTDSREVRHPQGIRALAAAAMVDVWGVFPSRIDASLSAKLLGDPSSHVRSQGVRSVGVALADPELRWRVVAQRLALETNEVVMGGLLREASRRANEDRRGPAESAVEVLLRPEPRKPSQAVVDAATDIVIAEYLAEGIVGREYVEVVSRDILQHAKLAGALIAFVGPRLTDADDTVRGRAWACLNALARATAEAVTARGDNLVADVCKAERELLWALAERASNSVRIVSGELPERRPELVGSHGEVLTNAQKALFVRDAREATLSLAATRNPRVTHDLLQAQSVMVDVAPVAVIGLVEEIVTRGRSGGYETNKAAVEVVGGVLLRVIEEHSAQVRASAECQRGVITVMDTFTEAGWPEMIRIAVRIGEFFRESS